MANAKTRFVCQDCGAVHPRWAGRCDSCGAWNTIVEEAVETAPKAVAVAAGKGRRLKLSDLSGGGVPAPRLRTGIGELDRVCGGGLVPGAAILIGGDPGIGKSTILLQAAARLSGNAACIYITGEEAVEQVGLRAQRLGLGAQPVKLAAATNVADIVATLEAERPAVAIVDSIQTLFLDTLDSAPGSVAQVRAAGHALVKLAKSSGMTVFLVGHVTKEGQIAGPRVLEHMVDTVLYFEGERGHHFRILRAVKNRYGATDEIGVFEMTHAGLIEVDNPSALFLAERRGNVSGSCVFAGMEGTRPVLVEIQALISAGAGGSPRRAVVGWDAARLNMLLAVLEVRAGLSLAGRDVFLNVAGGLKLSEPAADLAVAAALVSAALDRPMPADTVVLGEIGLSGEVRAVSQWDQRLKEAAKLGFAKALCPKRPVRGRSAQPPPPAGLDIREIGHIQALLGEFPDAPALREAAP